MPMRNTSHRLRSAPSWRRILLVLVTGVALGMASVSPHDPAEEVTGRLGPVEIAKSAVHPEAPAHFESAEVEIHPGCVACLAQLQTGSIPIFLPAGLPVLLENGAIAASTDQSFSLESRRLGPARAPPSVLSLSA